MEAISGVAVRKYAKEVTIDVRMTLDGVLVGASQQLLFKGKKLNIESSRYSDLQVL